MRRMLSHQAWIVLVGVIVFFTNLGSAALFDMDEALYASCAREMTQRGDWVVPWFNGQIFSEKPPLMFWLMMVGTSIFGATEFAVRAQAAVFGIGTALATYHIGRRLFRAEVGLWAGLIVSTSIIFTVSARAATVDSVLTFVITAAIWVLVAQGAARGDADDRRLGAFLPRNWLAFAAMYALAALAVLGKGPVGFIMPLGAIGLFVLMADRPVVTEETLRRRYQGRLAQAGSSLLTGVRLFLPMWALRWMYRLEPLWRILGRLAPSRVIQAGWRMRPLTALAVVALIAAPWYVLVGLRTDGQWLREFFSQFNLGPAFKKPILGHSGPWFYHILFVFVGFFPWSVFLGPTLVEAYRRIRDNHPWRVGYILVSCWVVAIFGFWSVIAMKLPHYVLPAYPALALLTAAFVYSWITEQERMSVWWMRNAAVTLIVVGVGMIVALPIVAYFFLPGEWFLGFVGLTLVVGGAACLYFTAKKQPGRSMVSFTAASVAFLTAMFALAVLRVDRHQNAPVLASILRQASPEGLELASFGYTRQSFVYYTGSRVAELKEQADVKAFLDKGRQAFVITTDAHASSLEQQYPGQFSVLTRHPKFLDPKRGELVVLSARPLDDVPQTAVRPDCPDTPPRR